MAFNDEPRQLDILRWCKQKDLLREWLTTGHSITQDEARDKFGIMRLSARISELKKTGMVIIRTWEPLGDARVARYSLG